MVVDDLFNVVHVVVTYLVLWFRILQRMWSLGKFLPTSVRNLCRMLVLTSLLNGGLCKSLFRCLFLSLVFIDGLYHRV